MPHPTKNNVKVCYRMKKETQEKLSSLAEQFGYVNVYGSGGAVGEFLNAIARGELKISKKSLDTNLGGS